MGHPQPHMDSGHDEDWEYECDPAETEDLYFTLDLTTHVPDALVQKPTDIATTFDVQANGSADQKPTGKTQSAEDEHGTSDHNARLFSQHTLQFLDLHTSNPLVKFDDGIYSCYWTTDLGTQFHVAQSGVVPKPRHEGAVLDVVGTSRCRLIGKPVTLVAKRGVRSSQPQGTAACSAIALDDDDDDSSEHETNHASETAISGPSSASGQPLIIPRENCKDLAGEQQASFLERLSSIKLKKGETDVVPIYNVKVYKEPDNMEELKKEALAADAAAKRKSKDEAAALKAERPRKRRKRLTAAEKGLVPEGTIISHGGRRDRASMAAQIGLQEEASFAEQSSRPRRAARDKPSRVEQYDDMTTNATAETSGSTTEPDEALDTESVRDAP